MTATSPSRRLFIDLENVSWAKPDVCAEPFGHVTLFVGPKQNKLDLEWTQFAIAHHDKIEIIRISESAPNALDFILACHLGRAAIQHPEADFCILSNDKGFDALVRHLKKGGLQATRQGLDSPAKSEPAPLTLLPSSTDLTAAWEHLQKIGDNRPKTKAKLSNHLSSIFRSKNLSTEQLDALIEALRRKHFLSIDAEGRVHYKAAA